MKTFYIRYNRNKQYWEYRSELDWDFQPVLDSNKQIITSSWEVPWEDFYDFIYKNFEKEIYKFELLPPTRKE